MEAEKLLEKLSVEVKNTLRKYGKLSLVKGDYWVNGILPCDLSVEVFVFLKQNFTVDLISDCCALLDGYPEDFRIMFVEAGQDGKPLIPLGGMKLSRYAYEVL